jgi:hypothetical protein
MASNFNYGWVKWKDSPYVIGLWNDWSRSGVGVRVLTLPSNESKILTAAIALFVATVSGFFWSK